MANQPQKEDGGGGFFAFAVIGGWILWIILYVMYFMPMVRGFFFETLGFNSFPAIIHIALIFIVPIVFAIVVMAVYNRLFGKGSD